MLKHIPFYASLLGRTLVKDVKATHSHVLVYGAIEAHSFGTKGCIASNSTIAEETGLAVGTVKNVLSHIAGAEWISVEYKDDLKQIRGVITPLIVIDVPSLRSDTPSLHSDTTVTGELHPRHSTVTRGNSLGNNKKTVRTSSEQSSQGSTVSKHSQLGAEVLKAFETVNPACKRMYGHAVQREACDFLIDEYGLENVKTCIELLPRTNTEKYFPKIYTPVHLRDKWQQWNDEMNSRKKEITNKKNLVI